MTVYADQALYGYADGHRLLASSSSLPPAVERRLLVASDVSPGTDGRRSLRALPLPDVGMWALSATWSADEMPRPGSVWTHTLLLHGDAIAALRTVGGLLSALKRPDRGDLQPYKRRVAIEEHRVAVDKANRPLLQLIVLALYGWPEQSAAVLARELEASEEALVVAWQQQWPALRARTGFAIRPRLGSPDDLDVQVAASRGRGSQKPAVLLESANPPSSIPRWVDVIASDLQAATGFGGFLWRFGPEAPRGRADVPALARIYDLFSDRATTAAFDALVESYPARADMRRLKRDCITSDDLWSAPPRVRLSGALHAADAIDWTGMRIGPQVGRVVEAGLSDAASLLAEVRRSRIPPDVAREAFGAAARLATPSLVSAVAEIDVEAAVALVAGSANLMLDPELWRAKRSWQRPLLAAIDSSAPIPKFGRSLVEAERDDLLELAIPSKLVDAVEVIGAIAASSGATAASLKRMNDVLHGDYAPLRCAALMSDASPSVRLLALAQLDPDVKELAHEYGAGIVPALDQADEHIRLLAASPLFLDGISRGPSGKALVQASFPQLHRALVAQRLPSRAWEVLDVELPWPDSWDSAERLRKALLDNLERQHWTKSEVAELIERSGPEAGRIRELADDRSGLEKFFDGVWKKLTFWD